MARAPISRRRRMHVYIRAAFACENCGRKFDIPDGYDGGTVLWDPTYRNHRGIPKLSALEVDHILPVKHGGTNDLGNLQALCTQCNVAKWSKLDWDGSRRGFTREQ